MCSRVRGASLAALGVALALAACGGEDRTTLPAIARSIEPACVDNGAAAPIAVHGSMPVKPSVSLSNSNESSLETGYRLWVGDVELTDVRWVDAATVTAVVPPGIAAGNYAVTVESPFGDRSVLDGAFRVAAGACTPLGAGLTITAEARPTVLNVGQQVAVTATVLNGGDATATGVSTAVSAPPGFTVFTSPTDSLDIPAGQTRTFTWTYTAADGAGHGTFAVTAAGVDARSGQSVTAPQASTNDVAVSYSIGGSVTGLEGSGLVLRLNGTTDLPVSSNGPFTFGSLPSGSAFSVEIASQPTGPTQTCNVSGNTGTVGTGAVTSVVVNCAVNTFTIGGTVTGLAGSGLVLHDSVSNQDVTITAAGTYAFATPIRSGRQYNVTVAQQPSGPTQSCAVQNGTGTVSTANVTNVNVTCQTASFSIGGAVSGYQGSGLVLRLNGTADLPIPQGATSYAFPAVPSGTPYTVIVQANPTGPTQSCVVANGNGTVGAANVTNVNVTCTTSTFTVGGAVSGLVPTSTGVVLRLNGAQDLTIHADGAFAFPIGLPSGTNYAVTVRTQPTGPAQTCSVTANGTGIVGSANVTNVAVTCTTNAYTVGGTITGYATSGLVLRNNLESYTVPAGATSFTFPTAVPSGGSYSVSVQAQPTNEHCTVSGGTGTVVSASITSVVVSCQSSSALAITSAVASPANVNAGGTVTVTATVSNSGQTTANAVTATIVSAPAGFVPASAPAAQDIPGTLSRTFTWTFTVPAGTTGGTFTIAASGIDAASGAAVTAPPVTTNAVAVLYAVGGTITGTTRTVGLQLNAFSASNFQPTTDPFAFVFPNRLATGSTYTVTVTNSPPRQSCAVVPSTATGTIGTADVTNVQVTCSTTVFTLTTSVTGAGTLTCGGGACDGDYATGSQVQVDVVPALGAQVVNVFVDTAPFACDAAGCSVPLTMTADHTVSATFGAAPF